MVTFVQEDGTALEEQTVAPGGTAVYSGETPAKVYDTEHHYIFAGWVDAEGNHAILENIQDAMVVYASFTEQPHDYSERNITPSTCTGEGQKEFFCSCGYSYLEALPLEGHKPDVIPAVPANCTETGMSEGSCCTVCDAVLVSPVETPALGHSPETILGKPATCVTSGLSNGSYCSVCLVKLEEQTIVPRMGHDMQYTNLGRTHYGFCSRCTRTVTEEHSFENDVCICGATQSVEATEDASLKINHTLNLASDISVNFAVSKALLVGFDLDTVYLVTELDTYEGNTKSGTKTFEIRPVEQGAYYYFTLNGLTAVHMNDRFRSVLYGVKDGQIYCSPTDDFAIADYAYSRLGKVKTSETLKNLCAELLRYGSAAQIYKGHRTDALVDVSMTREQKDRLVDPDSVVFGNTNVLLNDLEAPVVT